MNSGIIETLQHLSLVGAGAANSSFYQRRDPDASLHDRIMHLSRDTRPLCQPEIVTVAGLPLVKKKHATHAGAGGCKREGIKPAGLVKVRLHDKKDADLRGTAFERSVMGNYAKTISARRKIVIICGSSSGGGDPLRIEPIQFVLKRDPLRGAKTAGREVDFDAAAARTDDNVTSRGNDLVIDQHRLHANWWMALAPIMIRLEMDSSLGARKPHFAVGANTSGRLDASVNLRRVQTVAGSI